MDRYYVRQGVHQHCPSADARAERSSQLMLQAAEYAHSLFSSQRSRLHTDRGCFFLPVQDFLQGL